jgi:hypothetical protein
MSDLAQKMAERRRRLETEGEDAYYFKSPDSGNSAAMTKDRSHGNARNTTATHTPVRQNKNWGNNDITKENGRSASVKHGLENDESMWQIFHSQCHDETAD